VNRPSVAGEIRISSRNAPEHRRGRLVAREHAGHVEPPAGPYTIKTALDDYFAARESRGSKGVRADRYAAEARIVPDLGNLGIDKLTAKRIRDWHVQVAQHGSYCARERWPTSAPHVPWSMIRIHPGAPIDGKLHFDDS